MNSSAQRFGTAVDDPPALADSLPVQPVSHPSALEYARQKARRVVATITRRMRPSPLPKRMNFIRDELPAVALQTTKKVCTVSVSECDRGTSLSERFLRAFPYPIVFRDVLQESTPYLRNSQALAEDLAQSGHHVSVRVSNDKNVFQFCVKAHPWITEKRFTPPSFVLNSTGRDFVLSSLVSHESVVDLQRFYLQSEVAEADRIFEMPDKGTVMQAERRWVSTHGTVSTTHYDSAFSALVVLSGHKRLLLFPPEALPHMGVYPRGHPLHRRTSVDLSRPNAYLFREFWSNFADQTVEARLGPGDLVVFPPFGPITRRALPLQESFVCRIRCVTS